MANQLNREELSAAYLAKYPQIELTSSDQLRYTTYVPYVWKGRLAYRLTSRRAYQVVKVAQGEYLTKEEAETAIMATLPDASEKYMKCRDALLELQKTLDFNVDYHLSGDTYGIDEDYLYIDFNLNGFYFQFPVYEPTNPLSLPRFKEYPELWTISPYGTQ